MSAVIWDLMRADQYLGNYILTKDSSLDKTSESLKYYQRIFTIHHVTKEAFQESFTFYRTHPVLFKTLMDSIAKSEAAPTQIIAPRPAIQASDSPATKQITTDDTIFKRKIKRVVVD